MISGTVSFCWCGRLIPCPRHKDKEKPLAVKRVGKYSGFSKAFVMNGGAEELIEERD